LSPLIGVALRNRLRRQTGAVGVGDQQACQKAAQRLARLIPQAATSGDRVRRPRSRRQEQIQLSI